MVKRRSAKRRSMKRSRSMKSRARSMRGGKLTGDSSFSTLISSSSDNSGQLASQSGDSQQNVDRNSSSISGEGANINMSQFKDLIPPGAYSGGKKRRRHRKMRGGMGSVSDGSEAMKADEAVMAEEVQTGSDLAQQMGGRRRRKMRGGDDMAPMDPDTAPIMGGKRRMRGGMYDPPQGPGSMTASTGGTKKKRRGGGIIATAALPFGLFGLQKFFQGRKSEPGTQRRRRRQRA
jgi:hypothetical protein